MTIAQDFGYVAMAMSHRLDGVLTFNTRHFQGFASTTFQVVTPEQFAADL